MTSSISVKQSAEKLRKQGYSYSYISEKTGVSKSTLHYWLADISYKPNQHTVETIGKARAKSGEVKSKLKQDSLARAQREARGEIGRLSNRDLFMLGLGLYIGEGTKTGDLTRFVNSDPKVVRLMCRWFETSCGLNKSNFSLRIHGYPDTDFTRATKYWSELLGVSKDQFQKYQIDRRKGKRQTKKGSLPHGTLHVTIKGGGNKEYGVFLARKIKAWSEIVVI